MTVLIGTEARFIKGCNRLLITQTVVVRVEGSNQPITNRAMVKLIILLSLVAGALANPLQDASAEPFFSAWFDVEFHLYTRSNPTTVQKLELYNEATIRSSNFRGSRQTRFIIHGYQNNGNSDVNIKLRDAYLQKGDFNVIVVDWGKGANHMWYDTARSRIYDVGEVVAEFIELLVSDFGASVSSMQVAGHSLGAHTAGVVGKRLKIGKLPKIIGLDPAMPGFSLGSPGQRLDASDASYVEVIHTNSRMLGFEKPIGKVDIYPNYGFEQPGCGIDGAGTCAHGRAYEYYAESINSSKGFVATKCNDYRDIEDKTCKAGSTGNIKMGGEPLSTGNSAGVYFVATNSKSPFAQ